VSIYHKKYDIIVIGAGHAGCEAALSSARMGCSVLLVAIDLDKVAAMPCSPSIGGIAKGQIVKEIDALGGEMAKITDKTAIQYRTLNTKKRSRSPFIQNSKRQNSLPYGHEGCNRKTAESGPQAGYDRTSCYRKWQHRRGRR